MWPFKRKGIDINYIYALQEKAKYTPDYAELQEHWSVPVFMYNECMQDHGLYNLLLNESFYSTAFTANNHYQMWLGREDRRVVMLEKKYIKPGVGLEAPARVRGELYLVKPKVIRELDKYHENGVKFNRVQRSILLHLDSNRSKINSMNWRIYVIPKVWTYVGNPRYFDDRITNYDYNCVSKHVPREDYQRVGDHYYFSLHELLK